MALSSLSSSLSPTFFSGRSYLRAHNISLISRISAQNGDKLTLGPAAPVQRLNVRPRFGFSDRKFGVWLRAEKGENGITDESERLARGESTMPDRFKYLNKEAPDPPVRWPWFLALAFLVYAWRAVLFELSNWRKAGLAILRFVGDLLKLALALVFHFIGDPITSLIRFIETTVYSVRAFYSGIVAYTPVRELTTVILLASSVLAIGEAVAPDSVNSQPYILTVAGLIGYAAVQSYISEPFFWTLLVGLFGFSRLVKKRDDVTAALPSAAVLAAVGELWVRVMAITSYLALAIYHHHSRKQESESQALLTSSRRVPIPLLAAALAVGVRLAANWAGYRHLTWMIV